jgi:hypothetical protein
MREEGANQPIEAVGKQLRAMMSFLPKAAHSGQVRRICTSDADIDDFVRRTTQNANGKDRRRYCAKNPQSAFRNR